MFHSLIWTIVILSSVTLCECAEDDNGETFLEDLIKEYFNKGYEYTSILNTLQLLHGIITDVYDLVEVVRTSREVRVHFSRTSSELRPQVPAIRLKFTCTSRGLRVHFARSSFDVGSFSFQLQIVTFYGVFVFLFLLR